MFSNTEARSSGELGGTPTPQEYEFILPANSAFTVLGLTSGDTNAERACSFIGWPV